jgi:uncharacterized protein
MQAWRYSAQGVMVAVRVTPRGGRDAIDGIEQFSDGRAAVKVRVRVAAEGGAANRAVTELFADYLRVPKSSVRVASGVTSRMKQIMIDGDPKAIGAALATITAATDKT